MSRRGKWLVMCTSERSLPIGDVYQKVKMPSKARARLEGEVLVLTVASPDGEEMDVHVAQATNSPVIVAESAELADEYGAGRADQARIATYDARYEITWNLAESEYVFDTYYTIAYRLRRAVDGVTFDLQEKTFVDA